MIRAGWRHLRRGVRRASRLGGSRAVSNIKNLGKKYIRVSEKFPHSVAGMTAGSIFFASDTSCQLFVDRRTEWDPRRTLGIVIWGAMYYGGPLKWLYLAMDRVMGPGHGLHKAIFDVVVHTPVLVIPSFYVVTGLVKGQSPGQVAEQLREEWLEASTGSVLFWMPISFMNLSWVRQELRVPVTSAASFFHKLWLSWLSNRAITAALPGAATAGKSQLSLLAAKSTPRPPAPATRLDAK